MSEITVTAFLTFSNRARLRTALYGGSHRLDKKVIVFRRDGEIATVVTFGTVEDADLELMSINEKVDQWEASNAARNSKRPVGDAKVEYVSEFLHFSTLARLHMCRYGSSNPSGSKVFINGLDGGLSMIVELANAEDAELELELINEQSDKWEAAKEATRGRVRDPFNRR